MKPSNQLSLLLWYGVTGEGGELPWSDEATMCLDAAASLLGIDRVRNPSHSQALAVIDYAINFAQKVGM